MANVETQTNEHPSRTPLAPDAQHGAFIVDEATDEVLRLHLDKFEGPFEVLLYLIKAQEIDIFDIPIATITEQYLRFLDVMRSENLDVAGEFLVMAATLIQIKSRMLLPDLPDDEDELFEEDPRLELVAKLIEYRRFRDVTRRLEQLEEERANWFARTVKPQLDHDDEPELIEVSLYDLIQAFKTYIRFFSEDIIHDVGARMYSVDDQIARIEDLLGQRESVAWSDLLRQCTHKIEVICCLLAVLELCRMGRIRAYQHRTFDEIRISGVPEDAKG
ncbi:MAG TPA: segregation/condensation protein A [Candidatus Hydrogenedentes bacterium]|nr:segregation/condensation protein A [Candidatus Hydrogenedentota bacterium]HIJ74456.1 segregation/condensation protein A [Candidatus Hydrogenedentota bacterium]